ncbi:MAG: 3-keto-disaccharide hydrolase, partial [Flavitalea sp.]
MTVKPGSGQITTKEGFGDCQLHIEWRAPSVVKGEGQGRGNSGIFLMSTYELQILDSYNNKTYSNGQAGSIYKQLVPLANANKAPGEWQTYDVIFRAPRFNEQGILADPARITVLHNGV